MRMSNVDRETLARDLYNVYQTKLNSWRSRKPKPKFGALSQENSEAWLAVADLVLSGSLLPTITPNKPPVYLELGE